jgi:hypothetical protein
MKKIYAAALSPLLVFFASCKTRKSTFSSEGAAKGLDAMDVAFLFPSPLMAESNRFHPNKRKEEVEIQNEQIEAVQELKPLENAGYWAPLSQDYGGPVSDALLQQVFAPVKGTSDRGYGKGIFRFDQTIGTPKSGQQVIDMSELDRWRIVAYRFHPCPMEHEQKKQGRGSESCTPEVRLVAQPILGKNPLEAEFASQLPVINTRAGNSTNFNRVSASFLRGYRFGDYGMHVFYRLRDIDEARVLAQQLLELKNSRSGLSNCNTTDVEVGVHPCLESEANQIFSGIFKETQTPFAKELKEIFQSHMHTLHKISVWGSTQNAGPWGFYQGEVENNSLFKWKPITTVQKKSFANIQKENPFDDGFAMQYTRGASINGPQIVQTNGITVQSAVISETNTLRPDPLVGNDNLQFYLLNQLRFEDIGTTFNRSNRNRMDFPSIVDQKYQELKRTAEVKENIVPVGRYVSDLTQIVERIDNPKLNHEFKVDCVSCHMSRSENTFVSSGGKRAGKSSLRFSNREQELESLRLSDTYQSRVKYGSEPIPGVVGFTSSQYQSHRKGRFAEVYMINQFSHYFDMPVVSNRAANEIADSARFANETLLKVKNPGLQKCNQMALRACLLSQEIDRPDFLPYGNGQDKLRTGGYCHQFFCSAEDSGWSFEGEQNSIQDSRAKAWDDFWPSGIVGLFLEGSPAVDLSILAQRLAQNQMKLGEIKSIEQSWTSLGIPVKKSGVEIQATQHLQIRENPISGLDWKFIWEDRSLELDLASGNFPKAKSIKTIQLKGDKSNANGCFEIEVQTVFFNSLGEKSLVELVSGSPESFGHAVGSKVRVCVFDDRKGAGFLTLVWDNGETNGFFPVAGRVRENAEKEFANLALPSFLRREDLLKRLREDFQ